MAEISLPTGFRFGASTAAYQIEGAVAEDGRGVSIWDTFTAEPGRIKDGSSGAVACDHYHRYVEDIALMKRLGIDSYRFSLAWPRIQPAGSGAVEQRGLDFYDRLVDELVTAGIAPMATLYHWDLPQALEDVGGWLNRETAERFAEYARIVVERLGDRVESWVPVNEPNVAAFLGYALGMNAPGRRLGFDALPAAHHLNLAHGLAAQALRAGGARAIGCATNHAPIVPSSPQSADAEAAGFFDLIWNRLFAEPMLDGRYPEALADAFPPGDLPLIHQPLDFYGVNYYMPMQIGAAPEGADLPFEIQELAGDFARTGHGWPVVPSGLRAFLVDLAGRHPSLPPIRITENGCSYPDEVVDGSIDDQGRIAYLQGHLRAVGEAIEAGVDVEGYYCWSLLDNFEWDEGYTQRFGLVHVDYETQVRTPKASFGWYADLIRRHRA